MAVKTFTSAKLTSADTNTYLANAGLVYVASGALSGTATNFAGCFTSAYSHYKILIDDITPSGNFDLVFQFLVGTTPNNSAEYFWAYTGIRADGVSIPANAVSQTFGWTGITCTVAADSLAFASLEVFGPQTTTMRSIIVSNAYSYPTQWGARSGASHQNGFSAFDGIRFFTNSAVTVTGNVTIYGYRKA